MARDHLDGNPLLVLMVGTLCQVNDAHSAVADLSNDFVRTDPPPFHGIRAIVRERFCSHLHGRRLNKILRLFVGC